jgi:hypothetical protein
MQNQQGLGFDGDRRLFCHRFSLRPIRVKLAQLARIAKVKSLESGWEFLGNSCEQPAH